MAKKKKKKQTKTAQSVQNTEPTVIYNTTVDQVRKDRKAELDIIYPELKREDFATDAEYRQALVSQYKAMRQKEYGYTVQNEAMKAYIVFSEENVRSGKRVENEKAWKGYRGNAFAAETCIARAPSINRATDGPQSGSNACCAITASSMTAQISGKMGYDGKKNLIQPKSRYNREGEVTNRNNIVSAAEIDNLQSITPKYRFRPSKSMTLSEAVKNGSVGVGDEISIEIKRPSDNTTSGCHAMIIVDIKRDKNNNVISYTLMANNPPCLQVVDANSKNDKYGSKKLHCAVRTSKWITDKINSEIGANESIKSIEKKIAEERKKLQNLTDNMYRTETRYITGKRYNDKSKLASSSGFGSDYNRKAKRLNQKVEQTHQIEENRRKEKELAQREAYLREREEKCDADVAAFLAEHPEYTKDLEKSPTNEQCTIIPQETKSKDKTQREENVAARKDALRQKRNELDQREQELNATEALLKQKKAEAEMKRKQEEKESASPEDTKPSPQNQTTTPPQKKEEKSKTSTPPAAHEVKPETKPNPAAHEVKPETKPTPATHEVKPETSTPPAAHVIEVTKDQQIADYKQQYLESKGIEKREKTNEAQKENEAMRKAQEEKNRKDYEEAKRRAEERKKAKTSSSGSTKESAPHVNPYAYRQQEREN